jgi:hypothetical protein
MLNPGKEIYIICPELKQAKKIYWMPKRLQNYGPQEFVAEHRESELRTVFTNGSYIILDGCENFEAMRGIKPHLVFYDEFQHHSQYFDEEVMQPNLSSGKVSLLAFGTPPKVDCHYVTFRQNLLDNIARGNSKYLYMELHSAKNPTLDPHWLAEKKADLIRRDKYNIWLREYEGKMVFDTESAIFPFFDEKKHVYEHNYLMKLIHRDRHKLRWHDLYDPGTSTVFAGLFVAHNPYTGQVFFLDEIYAQERKECTTNAVYRKSIDIRKDLYDYEDEWTGYYDEAALWFANEVSEQFGRNLMPTHKQKVHATNEEARAGESILNTIMMAEGQFFVSDRCVKFLWEILQYMFDSKGRYPTKNDHCFHPDTLVDTDKGAIKIKDLVGKEGKVLSLGGKYAKFKNVRLTRKDALVFTMTTKNGRSVTCTGDHKFLSNGEWKELLDLKIGDNIEESIHKGVFYDNYYFRAMSGVFRCSLLSLRQVLQFAKKGRSWIEAIAQNCLGERSWAYSQGYACSPYRREQAQQFNRKFDLNSSSRSYVPTHDSREKSSSSYINNQVWDAQSKSMAQKPRGQGVAQSADCKELDKAQTEQDRANVPNVPKNIFGISAQTSKSLLKKLLVQGRKAWANCNKLHPCDYVKRIVPAGSSDVYCMEVEGTHALSIAGGLIAHNCMDLMFYYVNETNYTVIEEVDRGEDHSEGISKKSMSISQAIHAQKMQGDLSHGLGEDYYDEDPGDGIWN